MDITKDKKILDVTCGGRSIWFNKEHPLCLYCDQRDVEYEQTFGKAQPATRHIRVHPDMIADFTDKVGVDSGNCPMEDEQAEELMGHYGMRQYDPMDKPATEITPFDVYSPSELGLDVW